MAATVDAVLGEHGRIDNLVNNAGGQFMSPLKSISTKGFEAVVRNNLTGGYARGLYAVDGAARVRLNMVADVWNGLLNVAHSAVARAAMHNLTQTAACEWAASGVRVNSIAPDLIVSSGFDNYAPDWQAGILSFASAVPAETA